MKVDFSSLDSFEPIPEGVYPCRFESVNESAGKFGPIWRVQLTVSSGEHQGRYVFDTFFFGSKRRLRHFQSACEAVSLTTAGEQEIVPGDFVGKSCLASVTIEDYQAKSGESKRANRVQDLGYSATPEAGE